MKFKRYSTGQILFGLIILAALYLRLYNLSYMEFKGDEAFNSFKALAFAREGAVPLTSAVSSTGINEFPLFIYIIALPFYFTKNPVYAAGFIAVLNTAGVALCYYFVKRFYSSSAALIAAAFYAVNPWQIVFSRKIWTQDLLAPFILLFIYFTYEAVYEDKKRRIIPAMVSLAFVLQLHLSAAYFAFIAAAVIAMYWNRIDKKFLAFGCTLLLLLFLPYTIFQMQNNLVDVHTAVEVSKASPAFHKQAFFVPFKHMSTRGFEFLLGEAYTDFISQTAHFKVIDFLAMYLLLTAIIFTLVFDRRRSWIPLLWLATGTAYLAVNKADPLHDYYFLSFFPLYFILIGGMADSIIKSSPQTLKRGFYILIIAILAYQFTFTQGYLSYTGENTCLPGDYGTPYAHYKTAVATSISELDTLAITSDFERIHIKSCLCSKCDTRVTEYVIYELHPDYEPSKRETK